ncbi:tRNA lysidine(34) synthetase TilS [soil metagenome]
MACSGGRDSTVLLECLASVRQSLGLALVVLHVDHGLQAASAGWGGEVTALAARLGLEAHVLPVEVSRAVGDSVEESARIARYGALDGFCRQHDIEVLALGHHADDQAETLLLQLIRGAGVAGLSGMPEWDARSAPIRWRPLLGAHRDEIERHAVAAGLTWIDDPTNAEHRFARNAVRHSVVPSLQAISPGAVGAIARSATHLQQMLALEREIGEADMAAMSIPGGLSISRLQGLSSARRDNCLRTFVRAQGARVPGTERLAEIWRQLSTSRAEMQPVVGHGAWQFARYRDCLAIVPRRIEPPAVDAPPMTLRWSGEARWRLPAWRGEFRFEPDAAGVPEAILRATMLEARPRQGGERLRIAANRPRRTLKQLYQAFDVPTWQRDSVPLLYGDDRLVFVPHVGLVHDWLEPAAPAGSDTPRRSIVWWPDAG